MPLPPTFAENPLWKSDNNPIWIASSVAVLRNIGNTKFPTTQNSRELKNGYTMLLEAIPLKTVVAADQLTPIEKELISEHFLCLEGLQQLGEGQGFAIDENGREWIVLNGDNHLHIERIENTEDLHALWSRVVELEHQISSKIPFAFSQKFGFLTSDPFLCGTALIAHLYLHLPALQQTGQLTDLIAKEPIEEIEATSLTRSMDDLVADILVLKNRYTLGVAEEETINTVQLSAGRFVSAEKKLRSELKTGSHPSLKDHIHRAFGLLRHSCQLQTKEALDALSSLILGVDLGWVQGITLQQLRQLLFECRHAHLTQASPGEDLPTIRSTKVRESIQNINLI